MLIRHGFVVSQRSFSTKAVATALDQWDVRPGSDFIHYMESAIRESEFVLLICTPSFREKSDQRKGGVGYESSIIMSELFSRTHSQTKFVPILRAVDESSVLCQLILNLGPTSISSILQI
jgi:hypothetical protein